MSDYKREYEATHVMVKVPEDIEQAWLKQVEAADDLLPRDARADAPYVPFTDGNPYQIVLDTGDRVWIAASYMDDSSLPDVRVVNDGNTDSKNTHDHQGNMVLSVPAAWCKFYTPEEVEAYEQMRHADEQLLSYAR